MSEVEAVANMGTDTFQDVLLLNAEEATNLITVGEALDAMRTAYIGLANSEAQGLPRRRIYSGLTDDTYHWHNTMAGVVEAFGTLAVRIDSAHVTKTIEGRVEFPGDFAGFIMLFDLKTTEPYAIIHDHALSPLRVAATTGIVTERMARLDSRIIGLFGAGEQAIAQLLVHAEILPKLEHIQMYIPTQEKRDKAVEELSQVCGIPVRAVTTPEDAVRGADIVIASTNSVQPVIEGSWLRDGQHLVTTASPDRFIVRQEIDKSCVDRADRIVVNSTEQILADEQTYLYEALRNGSPSGPVIEIQDLIANRVSGRGEAKEVTLYDNNVGMGIQFAALGALMVRRALERGVGRALDREIFMTRRAATSKKFAP